MRDEEFRKALRAPVEVEALLATMEEVVEEIASNRYRRERCRRCGREHIVRRRGEEGGGRRERFPESWVNRCS